MKTKILLFIMLLQLIALKNIGQNALGCNGTRYLNDISTDTTKTTVLFGSNINAVGDTQQLYMDIIQPKGDTQSRRPVIMLAFGGAFVTGTRADMLVLANIFAKRGYVSMSIDYRLWNTAKLGQPDSGKIIPITIQAVHDMKAAVRWIRKSVKEGNPFRLDADNIIVGGISAGAITAMHTAHLDSTDNVPDFLRTIIKNQGGFEGNSGNAGYSSAVRAVINLSGGVYKADWIDANDPPFISYHGTADNIVPYDTGNNVYNFGTEGSAACYRQALKVKVPSLLWSVQGGGHVDVYNLPYLFTDFLPFTAQGSTFMQRLMCGQPPVASKDIDIQRFIKIYPNPAYDEMTVDLSEITEGVAADISVFNAVGQQVFNLKNQNTPTFTLRKEQIGRGMFLLKIQNKNQTAVKKIVFE